MGIIPTGKVERGGSTSLYSTEKEKEVKFDESKKERDDKEEIFVDKDENEVERRKIRSMDKEKNKEMERDIVSTFWLKIENNECYNDIAVYAVEVLVKEHKRKEVLEAKEKEIQNLFNYNVFEEVEDNGQDIIGSR